MLLGSDVLASKQSNSSARGFTLVELMIVAAIMGIMLSLVGPLTVQQLDNARRAQEREQVNLIIEEWRFYAQQRRRELQIETVGTSLHVYSVEENKQRLGSFSFEHLSFPIQTITINRNGFWQNESLSWYEVRSGESTEMSKPLRNRGVLDASN